MGWCSFPKQLTLYILTLLLILPYCLAFQFQAPSIACTQTTINVLTSCTFTMHREYYANVTSSPYETPVPANSIINITLPSAYTLYGNQSCAQVNIGGTNITGYTCYVNTTANMFVISGAILTATVVQDFYIVLTNITNPSYVLTLTPFVVKIGIDYSADGTVSYLTAGVLTALSLSFLPTTVNTTGTLTVSLTIANALSTNGSIIVTFPALKWTRQISSAHTLPLGSATCTAITNVNNATCTGSTSTLTVVLSTPFTSSVSKGSVVSFSIVGLFSPPTTQQVDSIIVATYTNNASYLVDQSSAYITGLTARTMALTITSGSTMSINSQIPLAFTFTTNDTINRATTLAITIPSSVTCSYVTLTSTTIIFSKLTSSSSYLTFNQSLSSPSATYSQTTATLTVASFTMPAYAQTTGTFYVRMYYQTGLKLEGSATITVLNKAYSATISTSNTIINSVTSYTFTFSLTDVLSYTGYFVIVLPSTLSFSTTTPTCTISSTSLQASPTVTYINTTSIKLSLLNTSSSGAIAKQSITITINNIVQPGSVRSIGNIILYIYYSSSSELVAIATSTTTITTTPGSISSFAPTPSTLYTGTNSSYTFYVKIGNPLPIGSYIIVYIPAQITVIGGGTCYVNSVQSTCTVSTTLNTLTFPLSTTSTYSINTTITLVYSILTNPPSTQPTSTYNASTLNTDSQVVDILYTNVTSTMSMPNALTSVSVSRASKQNSITTTYTFQFTQPQYISGTSAILNIVLPSQIYINSSLLGCSWDSVTISCTYINSTSVNAIFTPIPTNSTTYTFAVTGILNPPSFRPTTTSILLTTLTSTLLYQYSTSNTTGLIVTNTLPSSFSALTYTYSPTYLLQLTNLTVTITDIVNSGYMLLYIPASFNLNSSSVLKCTSTQFTPICTYSYSATKQLYYLYINSSSSSVLPITFTILVSGFIAPSSTPTDYASLISYTADGYTISSSTSDILFTLACTLPCRSCSSSTSTSVCVSCYQSTSNITSKVYLYNSTCVSVCPSTYYSLSYQCYACASPCLQCTSTSTYCTSCNTTSNYTILYRYSTSSTCVGNCSIYMYADYTQVPYLCVQCISPCLQCTNASACTTCIDGYSYYLYKCLSECPANTTVQISSVCYNCSSECLTCGNNSTTYCTSCSSTTALYNNTCLSTCPSTNMYISNSVCSNCSSTCYTCSVTSTNCTSCNTSSSSVLTYLYQYTCVTVCPDYYYASYVTAYTCELCSSVSGLHCVNCTSSTKCAACDTPYVLYQYTCVSQTPAGYVNISGVAVQCSSQCATCSIVISNCTSCSSSTLYLYGNTCQSSCPTQYIGLDKKCVQCTYPCLTCTLSVTKCTSCYTNSSLYLSASSYSCVQNCSSTYYANTSTLQCTPCISPCLTCNTSTTCLSCVNGYYLINSTLTCQQQCPTGTVGISKVCQACLSPCEQCINLTTKCTTCISSYYYNSLTYQCLQECPSGQIANQTSMQCMSCVSPCKTCTNTTDTCISCVTNYYLSGSQCVSTCPDGYYGSSSTLKCLVCTHNCTTCSSAILCTSCTFPLYLYSSSCVQECPVAYKYLVGNVCTSCASVVSNCGNCSTAGVCYQCISPTFLFNRSCISSCPSGYSYSQTNSTSICIKDNSTTTTLETTLQSTTFPLPFTILAAVVVVACCMSKLQNSNTYLIGLMYSLLGIVEMGVLGYLIYIYYTNVSSRTYFYVLLGVAGGIYFLNLLATCVQSPYLQADAKFRQWRKNNNTGFYLFVVFVGLLINYKFKMLIFSRLFRFHCTSAQLESIHKFRIFNIFSLIGVLPQALCLYICFTSLSSLTSSSTLYNPFLDTIIIYILNIVLSVATAWKQKQFFHQQNDDGVVINKVVDGRGEDYSHGALVGFCEDGLGGYYGPETLMATNNKNVNQLEASLTGEYSQSNSSNRYKVANQYMQNTESKLNNTNTNAKGRRISPNIFRSPRSNQDHYSQHQSLDYQLSSQQSQQQRAVTEQQQLNKQSNNQNQNQNQENNNNVIKTHQATDKDHVINNVSAREMQLDLITKQIMEDKKMTKKRKGSGQQDSNQDQNKDKVQYEAMSIKDSSQRQNTQYDSNAQSSYQRNVQKLQQEQRQPEIDNDSIIHQQQQRQKQQLNQMHPQGFANIKEYLSNHQNQQISSGSSRVHQKEHNKSAEKQEQQEQQKYGSPLSNRKLQEQKRIDDDFYELKQKQKINEEVKGKQSKIELFDDDSKQQEESSKKQQVSNPILQENIMQSQIPITHARQQKKDKTQKLLQFMEDSNDNQNIQENQNNKQNNQIEDHEDIIFNDPQIRKDSPLQKKSNKISKQFDELQDSEYEDDKINQRPYSAARKQKQPQSEALLQILSKAGQDRKKVHPDSNSPKHLNGPKAFKYSGGPVNINEQSQQKQPSKSKVYLAGMRQLNANSSQQPSNKIGRKQSANYALDSMRKKNEQQIEGNSIRQNRNKSIGAVPYRKFTSRDVSADYLDQLDASYVDNSKVYEEYMKQSEHSQRKPFTSQTNRTTNKGPSRQSPSRNNLVREQSNDDIIDQSLVRYYKRGQNRSNQKINRKQSKSKQKNVVQAKRLKQLQQIYLQRL